MPIVLRHSSELELSRVDYSGAITAADFHAHAQFNAANPEWLGFDCLSIALADVDIRGIAPVHLEQIFHGYKEIFEPLNLLIMRRSAWLCETPAARPLLEHWLNMRRSNPHTWSEIRLFDTYGEVADWLLLTPPARRALETCHGFTEIARFGAATPTRSMAR